MGKREKATKGEIEAKAAKVRAIKKKAMDGGSSTKGAREALHKNIDHIFRKHVAQEKNSKTVLRKEAHNKREAMRNMRRAKRRAMERITKRNAQTRQKASIKLQQERSKKFKQLVKNRKRLEHARNRVLKAQLAKITQQAKKGMLYWKKKYLATKASHEEERMKRMLQRRKKSRTLESLIKKWKSKQRSMQKDIAARAKQRESRMKKRLAARKKR